MARVRQPQIQVTFYDARIGSAGTWDLEPYLGEGCSVSCTRSVRDIGGAFTITLVDRAKSDLGDSLYYFSHPMDGVEIRMSHDDRSLPLVFRGFISEVRREEVMGADGRPNRRVIISGQSTGKILLMQKIYYAKGAVDSTELLSSWKFLDKYLKDGAKTFSVESFVDAVNNEILTPALKVLTASSEMKVNFTTKVTSKGSVSPFFLNSFVDRSVYELLSEACDVGPFNELYVDDKDGGIAEIVMRPNPFFMADGGLADPDASPPDEIHIDNDDLVGITHIRTDANVANVYWVYTPEGLQSNSITRNEMYSKVDKSIWDIRKSYLEALEKYYGYRVMEVSARLLEPGMSNPNAGKEGQVDSETELYVNWTKKRVLSLRDQNKDNGIFEKGSMQLYGNHQIKPGFMILLQRKNVLTQYYAVSVTQNFEAYGVWTTHVQFERGRSRLDRGSGDYAGEIDRRGAM